MADLTEFLFPAPAPRRLGAIVRWWEARRLHYNVLVGAAGAVSVGMILLLSVLPPAGRGFLVPWQAVVLFGVLANLCYGLGAAVEVSLAKVWGRSLLPTGPTLFRMGLTFSMGLALLPSLMAGIDWLWRIARWLL